MVAFFDNNRMSAAEEKPIHVRVAEALGWSVELRPAGKTCSECGVHRGASMPFWVGWSPMAVRDGDPLDLDNPYPPHYDTDWSAGGPLIEEFGIKVEPNNEGWSGWAAFACQHNGLDAWGATPLLAVCNLILALDAAGKLGRRK